jgi:hypothetical protein
MGQQFQGIAPARQPVFDAAQDQRAAMLRLSLANLGQRQPVRGQDAGIQLA